MKYEVHICTSTKKGLGHFWTGKKFSNIFYKNRSSLIVSKRLLTKVFVVLSVLCFLNYSAIADGQCTYNTTTVIENGVEISKNEIRICSETETIGKQKLLTEDERLQIVETVILLGFIFLLEHI